MRGAAVAAVVGTLVALALDAGTTACTLTLPGSDDGGADGSSGGTGGNAGNGTPTQQCTTVFTELCTQAISRCGLQGFSLDQCINANLPTCACEGSACSQASHFPTSDVSACTSAIDQEDCNAIINSVSPAACEEFVSSG